jgi:hypothetical protein
MFIPVKNGDTRGVILWNTESIPELNLLPGILSLTQLDSERELHISV